MATVKTLDELWDKFYSYVKVTPGCWWWLGAKNPKGYGRYHINGKTFLPHRVSYYLYHGKIPQGLKVLHQCDNPSCVNPWHLKPGTPKQNTHEALQRGQIKTRLSNRDVMEIRDVYLKRGCEIAWLARTYEVSEGSIRKALFGQKWRIIP